MRLKPLATIALTVAIATGLLKLYSRPHFLDVDFQIDRRKHDVNPKLWGVTPKGCLYCIEEVHNKVQVRSYTSDGKGLWLKSLDQPAQDYDSIIASFESSKPQYVALKKHWRNSRTLLLDIQEHGIVAKKVAISPSNLEGTRIIPSDSYVYITGQSGPSDDVCYPTVIQANYVGKRLWKNVASEDIITGPAAVDNNGNLILIGDIGAGVGPFVAKYSAAGRCLWKRETVVPDGTEAIWVGADSEGRVATIFQMHSGIMESSGDDISGRKQDFVLSLYDSNGNLRCETILAHGAWIWIADATMNDKGEFFIVGNRYRTSFLGYPGRHQNAQLIKCTRDGQIVWSHSLGLPRSLIADQIRVDENGGIYIFTVEESSHQSSTVVYKVKDPGSL